MANGADGHVLSASVIGRLAYSVGTYFVGHSNWSGFYDEENSCLFREMNTRHAARSQSRY